MAVQIPGFCGIYFNQPIPSNVKFRAPNDYSGQLQDYEVWGCERVRIEDGYIPKRFMSYDSYWVRLIPGPNHINNLMNVNYISSLKVGAVSARYYGGDKDIFGATNENKINEEMVKTCFNNTKAFLKNWLENDGKYKSLSRESVWHEVYDYDLPNNHIKIMLYIKESSEGIIAQSEITVFDKFFYNYSEGYLNNQKQGDIDAFM